MISAITVAMEVTPKGELVREAFVMKHDTLESAQKWEQDLPKQFKNGSYKTLWKLPRIKKADSIHARGNVLKANSYLFKG